MVYLKSTFEKGLRLREGRARLTRGNLVTNRARISPSIVEGTTRQGVLAFLVEQIIIPAVLNINSNPNPFNLKYSSKKHMFAGFYP